MRKAAYRPIQRKLSGAQGRITIKGPANNSTAVERFEGAMMAFKAYGGRPSETLIVEGDYVQKTGCSEASGYRITHRESIPGSRVHGSEAAMSPLRKKINHDR